MLCPQHIIGVNLLLIITNVLKKIFDNKPKLEPIYGLDNWHNIFFFFGYDKLKLGLRSCDYANL